MRKAGARLVARGHAAKAAVEFGAIKDGWNGFSVLHSAASRVAALDLGVVPATGGFDTAHMASGGLDVLFLLGADEIEVQPGPFVVYIGTHAQTFVTLIGATTALFAATIGLVQNDIKRIVAYSTCLQLGYMMRLPPARRSSGPT